MSKISMVRGATVRGSQRSVPYFLNTSELGPVARSETSCLSGASD
jgi:hypothetical protein